ncbi:MAG: zinc-binding dehydrogenase [Pseudomonadota bacterium]
MRQIWIPKPGPPDVLELREAPDPQPASGEVRIRVAALGVNFAEIMGRLGMYPDLPPMPVVPGYEVSGRVDAIGADVDEQWGDAQVLALTRFGGYSDTVCVPVDQVYRRPPDMDAPSGAALPVNYVTAYQLIEVMGALRDYETVLIHSAGGGVGIAAIQLAKHIGATVIGTASQAKHGFLTSIGVDQCIDYQTEDFVARVNDLTGGRGVELVLDAIGGASWKKSYRVLSHTGRLGMFGLASAATGKQRSRLSFVRAVASIPWFTFTPPALMARNRGVFGVNVGHLWGEIPRVRRWMDQLLDYFVTGAVAPVIDRQFTFDEAADAHAYIQERRNIGKVLLVPDASR